MNTLLLLDIDGTLLRTGAGRVALERVFHGTNVAFDFPFSGLTDCDIISRALESIDVVPTVDEIERWLERYVPELTSTLDSMTVKPLDGVIEFLSHFEERCVASVGTGNCKDGAAAKLRAASIDLQLQHGVFGDRHRSRSEMFRDLASKDFQRLVVIGDTPADIDAGRACDALTIGVTTGSYERDALADADVVVDDLRELIETALF